MGVSGLVSFTCYTHDGLRPETDKALNEFVSPRMTGIRYKISPENVYAYGEALACLWKWGVGMFIVEPDIVVREDVVDAVLNCGCSYGCFPYAWTTNVGPALGCTWFKDDFVRKYPTAMAEVGRVSWRQFDVVLMRHILARKYGEQPHVHLPAVSHLNEAKQLLPEADPTPMMEVPHW